MTCLRGSATQHDLYPEQGLIPLGKTLIGGGGLPYFPMARSTMGGLLFSTVVTLIFLPSIYVGLDNLKFWGRRVLMKATSALARILKKQRLPSNLSLIGLIVQIILIFSARVPPLNTCIFAIQMQICVAQSNLF